MSLNWILSGKDSASERIKSSHSKWQNEIRDCLVSDLESSIGETVKYKRCHQMSDGGHSLRKGVKRKYGKNIDSKKTNFLWYYFILDPQSYENAF